MLTNSIYDVKNFLIAFYLLSNSFVLAQSRINPTEELVLADNGIANYLIYYNPDEGIIVEHAALELGQWLDEITGATFNVTTDVNSNKPLIVVGKNNPLTLAISEQIELDSISSDGFRIITYNNNLYITGIIDRGTLYGVYYLLENYFGMKWFSPEFEVVPHYSKLTISEVNDLQNPRFNYREIFSGDTDDAYFRQHNLLNGNRGETHRVYIDYPSEIDNWSKEGPSGGHNFYDIVGSVYRYGGQIEVMNNAVRTQAAGYFTSIISDEGIEPWYGFSQEDNGWDPDYESLSFAEAHGNVLSAPIVDMIIDIADKVRTTHPNAHLSTLAYQWSFNPPTGITIPEYIMVETAPIEADFGYPYSNSIKNNNAYNAFIKWNQISSSLAVWDYNANFQNYLQPLPNIFSMFENIKFFASLKNYKSYFGQGAYNTVGAEFAELRAWVAAKLLWNPNQNYENLIKEFCDGYYGSASTYIIQYINLLHSSFINSNDRISSKQRITSEYLNLDFILQADKLLAAADATAGGDYAKHVHDVRIGIDMTILLREHMYEAEANANGITWVHDSNRRNRFNLYATNAGITNYSEDSEIERLYTALDIRRLNPPKPDFIANNTEWIDFQDLDFTFCCGANMVEDSLASDHGAIAYSGDEWAVTLKLDMLPPGNKWDLYAYVRADVTPNADSTKDAFNMGVNPGTWISPKVSEVNDGQYHLFKFPDMPVEYKTGSSVWFSTDSPSVENLFIDRIIAVNILTGVNKNITLLNKFELKQNYPNPFNPSTTIKYSIPLSVNRESLSVSLKIYDILGREVVTLVNKEQKAGNYEIKFNALHLTSGIYFYKLQSGSFVESKKMLLLK